MHMYEVPALGSSAGRAFRRFLPVVILGVGCLADSALLMAQGDESCPLPFDQQLKAVNAFAEMIPFIRHPRCSNCHGGVNPFIEESGPDPEDPNVPPSQVEHGGGRMFRENATSRDGQRLIETGCNECHASMAPRRDGSKSNWMTAPGFLSFVDKDTTTICRQIKRSLRTAEELLGQLRDDNGGNNFVGTAFNGDRGLDRTLFPEDEVATEKPPGTHAQLTEKGKKWVDILGDGYSASPDCGCVKPKIEGSFSQTATGDFGDLTARAFGSRLYGVSSNPGYTVHGDLVWEPEDTGDTLDNGPTIFRPISGDITVEISHEVASKAGTCKSEGNQVFSIADLPRQALAGLFLELADDGSYRLSLGMSSRYLQVAGEDRCRVRAVGRTRETAIYDAAIALGVQPGTTAGAELEGSISEPIRNGGYKYTGSWSFQMLPTR